MMSADIIRHDANAMTMYDKISDPIAAVEKMGEWLADSGLAGTRNAAAGKVIAMKALFSRQNPLDVAAKNHVIDGKLSMRADAMLAEFDRIGGSWEWVKFDCEACVAKWTYKGKTTEISYTKGDAERAGLWGIKGNWTARPDAMLRARCISKAIRMIAPSVCFGAYTPEEIEDEKYVEAHVVSAHEPLLHPNAVELVQHETTDDDIESELQKRFTGMGEIITTYLNEKTKMKCDHWTNLSPAEKRLIFDKLDGFMTKVDAYGKSN